MIFALRPHSHCTFYLHLADMLGKAAKYTLKGGSNECHTVASLTHRLLSNLFEKLRMYMLNRCQTVASVTLRHGTFYPFIFFIFIGYIYEIV